MKNILSTFALTTTLFISNLSSVSSQIVTNGSFNNATGNSVTPAGWANVLGNNPGPGTGVNPTVDVLGGGFTSYSGNSVVPASPSPEGGTWVGLSSIQNFENEAIQQNVPGFVIGQTYQVQMWVANFGGPNFSDPGTITVYANNVAVVTSPVLNLTANAWIQITGTFVATATNMVIQIDAFHSTGAGGSGYYSVDGLTIIPLCAANGIPNLSQINICLDQQTFDLGAITSSNIPAGTVLTWHSAIPVTNATQLAAFNNVPLGNYYGAFYDAVNNCYGPPQLVQLKANPIASFTAANVCDGNNVSFVNTSTVPAPNVLTNWDWVFGDNALSAIENPTHLFAGENNYSNQLTVTADNGCTDVISTNVTVWPLPNVSFNAANVCLENEMNFNNTSTISNLISANTIAVSLWTFGDGTNGAIQNATHTYLVDGIFNVTLQETSANGCVNSLTQPVTIYPKPTALFSAAAVCSGVNSLFIDNSTVGGPDNITNWNWTFGDNATSAVQNPAHQFASEQIYTDSLIVTTNNGCLDTFVLTNTVWPLPQVAFSVTDECLNFANVFTNNSTISNAFTNNSIVQWDYSFGDGATANTTNTSHVYANDGIFNAQLLLTSNHGCQASLQQPVTVHPKPNASFTGINLSGCSPICPVVNSTSNINAPGVNTLFSWIYSDGFTEAGTSSARCFENATDATQTFGLTLYVTSDKGCKDTATDPNYIQVYHLPIADFNFSPNDPSVIDLTVQFENLSQFANSYSWSFGNLSTSNQFDPTITFPFEPTSYTVQLIASTIHNCLDTIQKVVEIKDVVLIHVPNTFTPNGDGVNNIFKPVVASGVDPFNFSMYIFNRWGEMVFESHDFDAGWNGSYGTNKAETGTYTWKIEYKTKTNGQRKEMNGHVNLLK